MIKVVQIQYSTSSAGRAALRLQKAFLETNIDSSIVSLHSDITNNPKIRSLGRLPKWIQQLDNKLRFFLTRKNIKQFGLFSYPILGTNISRIEEVRKADYIYIHWALNGFLNLKSIEQLAMLNKPIIIFMHDMWSITGGCHYSFTCEKYITDCNNCQMFPGEERNDLSHRGFSRKLKLYSSYNNFFFVSPSRWLYDCAKKSLLTKDKPLFHIPNILDYSIFKPFNKRTAKQIINIDLDEIVIAFGAMTVRSPYKGWNYLQKALELLPKNKNISVLIFGSGYSKEIADKVPFKTKFMGYLKDEYSSAVVYNAADVFVAPSSADNLPFTVLEALSCGTPVVAFNIGGMPDLVKHKANGYLAAYQDSVDLAEGIKYCLDIKISGYRLSGFDTAGTIKKHMELFDYIKKTSFKI